jgi:hypothetical protein
VPAEDESSLRAVALDPETVIVLRAHRSRQERQFAKAGITPQGWVFTHEDGEPLSPSYLTHKFNDLVEGAGLPPARLHDLRHAASRDHRLTIRHPRTRPVTARGPTPPERPEDPDNATPARQPGLQRVNKDKHKHNRPIAGPTWDQPRSHQSSNTEEQALEGPAQTGCAARDLNPEPAD